MCQTRAGESGSWFGIAPNETNGLATALAIRPPIGMIAPSPAPLTPSGLLGDRRHSALPDQRAAGGARLQLSFEQHDVEDRRFRVGFELLGWGQ